MIIRVCLFINLIIGNILTGHSAAILSFYVFLLKKNLYYNIIIIIIKKKQHILEIKQKVLRLVMLCFLFSTEILFMEPN